jgi:hypothetical protein
MWFPDGTSSSIKHTVYNELLQTLKGEGLETSYQKLDIEYQQLKYREKNQFISDFFQRIWWNYGYEKERIFSWILWITIFLTIINTLFLYSLMGSIYEMNFLNYDRVQEHRTLHHPFLGFFLNLPTGFCYTVILLMGGAFGIKFNSSQIKLPGFLGLIYIITIGLIGISFSAFILNLIIDL